MRRARNNRRRSLIPALALASACAVAPTVDRSRRIAAEPRPPTASTPRANAAETNGVRGLPTSVRVRLEGLERRAVLEILEGDGTPLTLRRDGNRVVAVGATGQAEVVLHASPHGPRRIEGRAYPDTIVVVPHPQSGLRVYNDVALESYVAGVVAAELPLWSAAPSELEAQAIAARSYAALQLERRTRSGAPAELVDGVLDQAYRGLYQAKSAGERAVAERLDAAVRATAGIVLWRGDGLEEARFHASCGGSTAAFSDIFPEPGPGPKSVACESCRARAAREAEAGAPDAARPLAWSVTIPMEALARAGEALGLGGAISAVAPRRLDTSGRWIDAQVRGPKGVQVVTCDALRRAFGYSNVKSARLVRAVPPFGQPIQGGLVLEGLGRGHGVGLCQEGARDLARSGLTAEAILAVYYPDARLVRLGPARAVEAAYRE